MIHEDDAIRMRTSQSHRIPIEIPESTWDLYADLGVLEPLPEPSRLLEAIRDYVDSAPFFRQMLGML
jgi:hypothetical protein